tara:strand:- start:25 stop:720 length:696 start_codon:yes stop_codon:yes gene_type:complete
MANSIKQITRNNGDKANLGDIEIAAIKGVEQGANTFAGANTFNSTLTAHDIHSNYIAWATGDYDNLTISTKSDANCDSGFTFEANALTECACTGDATNAFVLPAATLGTLVVMRITAQYDGGNNATFTTAAGDFYAAQTLNFITQNAGDTIRVAPRVLGASPVATQTLGKISTFTAAHNTLTLSTTATNNQTNKGAELSFYCQNAGFWRIAFLGSELGSGAMNATFAGSTA